MVSKHRVLLRRDGEEGEDVFVARTNMEARRRAVRALRCDGFDEAILDGVPYRLADDGYISVAGSMLHEGAQV